MSSALTLVITLYTTRPKPLPVKSNLMSIIYNLVPARLNQMMMKILSSLERLLTMRWSLTTWSRQSPNPRDDPSSLSVKVWQRNQPGDLQGILYVKTTQRRKCLMMITISVSLLIIYQNSKAIIKNFRNYVSLFA